MLYVYSLPLENIVKVHYVYIDQNKIYTFMEKETSLYRYLHVEKEVFSIDEKYQIWFQIWSILSDLHELEVPIFHQHLSSRNIFIQKYGGSRSKFIVKVGDLGDLELRNTAKIFARYEIRNAWSSPELLLNPDLAFSDSKKNSYLDIYSLGMIIWEVYSCKIPFADSVSHAKEFVTEKQLRPKIDESIPKNIAYIIQKWWQEDPSDRFKSMKDVRQALFQSSR